MSAFKLYLFFQVIPWINKTSDLTGIYSMVVLGITIFVYIFGYDQFDTDQFNGRFKEICKKLVKYSAIILVFSLLAPIFLPDKQNMALILGVSSIEKIQGIDKLPPKLVNYINNALDDKNK